jgi:putative endopeptidase
MMDTKRAAVRILKWLSPALFLLACHPSSPVIKEDFLAANIDSSVRPSDNFSLFSMGSWIRKTPIPEAESQWGLGDLVQEELYSRLRKINEEAEKENATKGSISQKIGDFWYSGMDSVSIENKGLTPLQQELDQIDAIQSKSDLFDITADLHRKEIYTLFTDYIYQDDKSSNEMAYHLLQGGLGMPNRDYYFNSDKRTVEVRRAYSKYLFLTFKQLGADSNTARKKSASVYHLETRLAGASRKLVELRDPYRNYNKMDLAELKKLSPDFDWPAYLSKIGITALDSIIVGQPEFFTELNNSIKNTSLEDWKDYLRFQLVFNSAKYLDNQTYTNYFNYHRSLSGVTEPRARWKRVLDAEETAMGEALGQLFVKEYFNEKAKQRYSDLIEAIRSAFKERISNLEWMSDGTKQKALEKLGRMTKKVGYPDKWKDFSALLIDRGPFVLNMQRANQWWHKYNVDQLGKPVDRTEWDFSPQTYNAYYSPSNNEIVMPAGGFIIPGKKDEDLDDAFVYGYAGANWIGHEITHGFDDTGRQYDENGNLKNWWQKEDSIQFALRAEKIIREFNEFNPVDTFHINGEATQGENIADLGGLLLGFDAFQKTEAYKKGEKIGGFTPTQRFFLGYAYGYLLAQRKESMANQIMTDEHALANERINGPLSNIPEFYKAFNVKPGDKMYRPDSLRVSIW